MKTPQAVSTRSIIAVIVAIAILAAAGWCVRRNGIGIGGQDQRISAAAAAVQVKRADVVVADQAAKIETKKLIAKNSDYRAARAKLEVKGDSVFADGQRLELPSVAIALNRADTLSDQVPPTVVKQDENTAARDSLIASLDSHVDLLQEAKRPRCSRKCGIAIGVAGTAAVVYVAVRIIQAVGHR